MESRLSTSTLAFITLLMLSNHSLADELPLWELGVGVGVLHQPYYPGSAQTRNYAFPVPAPIYRGDVFKSDDDGMRAEILNSDRVKLDMSLDFNFAVDSDDVPLRNGMDDIGSLLQIGPSLEVLLAKNDTDQWLLNFPIRANFEIDGTKLSESGYTFAPNITYFKNFNYAGNPWRIGAAFGPQFGSSDYQNVYYGVNPEFSSANRPAYKADSGYSGSRLLLTLRSKNQNRLWVWFLRYDNISGASFADSPLVENDGRVTAGLIYSRFLFKSKTMVKR